MAAVRELVQTAPEIGQHLILEGDYLPSEWRDDLHPGDAVDAVALVFSERYVKYEFEAILAHAEAARHRLVAGEEHVTRDELRVAHAAARERFPCRPGLGQL